MSTALTTRSNNIDNLLNFSSPTEVIQQMQAMEDELSRMAFGFFQQRGPDTGSALNDWLHAESVLLQPLKVSIDDKGDHLAVTADVPGFSSDEIKVDVEGDVLRICGKSEESQSKKKGTDIAPSSTIRKISCKIALPAKVESKGATATLAKGMLTLTLPKMQPASKIEVKAA